MNIKFQEAIDESIRAAESSDETLADIEEIVRDLDEALSQKTGGAIHASLEPSDRFLDEEFAWAIALVPVQGEALVLCHVTRDDSGYPVAVHYGPGVKTMCGDRESLEWKIASLLRDPKLGQWLRPWLGSGARDPQPVSSANK